MMVWVNVMMVMLCIVVVRLCALGATLLVRRVPSVLECEVSIFASPSRVFAPSCLWRRLSAIYLVHSRLHKIASLQVSRGAHSGRRGRSISRMMRVRRSAPHARAKAGKHTAEFHLDSWVVSSWSNVSGLRSLHSLRQRRVPSFAIKLRTDTSQQSSMHSASILFVLLLAVRLHSVMILICHWPLHMSISRAIVMQLRRRWRWARILSPHLLTLY